MLSFLIRLDFVLAVALLVVAPLALLVAALRRPGVRGRLLAYWRASSLLMITVYLMIDGRPVAFAAGNAALVLIPLALYHGDVVCPARHHPLGEGTGATWFRRWRGAATGFCGASLLLTVPALRCVGGAAEDAFCSAWLQPPRELHRALHPGADPAVLGDVAMGGLLLYGTYLGASIVRRALASGRS